MSTTTATLTEAPRPEEEVTVLSPTAQAGSSISGQDCTISQLQLAEDSSGPVSSPEDQPFPSGSRFWLTILASCIFLILGGLDANIVATAVPSITDHFHTVQDVGWYSSAFRLCTCAFQFFFGKMYKLFSVKRVFILSNVIFLIGSLLCATAVSSPMFVLGRAVTGIGFAGELSGCFAISTGIVPVRRWPVFAGCMACVESLAVISAPIVGGLIIQRLNWRWCFWINLPIGGGALLALCFLFSDPPGQSEERHGMTFMQKLSELDLISNCLFIPSLTALFIALAWAGTKYPWTDGRIIGLFVVFAVLLVAFGYNQYRRGDSAILPYRIVGHRNVIAGFIFTMCTNSMTNVLEYYLPTYYQIVRQLSPGESGILMIPILLGMMLGLMLQGIGTTTLGYYAPFMIFGSICMPVAAGLMTTFDLDTTLVKMLLYSGFAGFSGGIGFQGPQSALRTTLPAADVNMGIGVILFGQSFGPAVTLAISQVIFTNKLAANLGHVVPGLTSATIDNDGLGNIQNGVPKQQWAEVFDGIDKSLTTTWNLAVALGCATMVGSLMVEWKSVKHKQS